MTLLVFIYVYRIDMNIERLMPCSNKHNLHLKSPSNKVYFQIQATKYDKLLLQVQWPGQSDLQLPIFKLAFDDAIN